MRALVAAIVVLTLAVAILLGGVVRESRIAAPVTAAAPIRAEALRSGFATGDTALLVRRLDADAAFRPDDPRTLALLGFAYAQLARESGDAGYTARAERAFRRALRIAPADLDALTGLGGVALTRHRFRDALELAGRALAVAPDSAAAHGVRGDALLELGRYDAAFDAFDRMSALKPNISSYARVAYARELRGDVAGATEAMELALDASIGRPEASAWTLTELGKLQFGVGRLRAAARSFRAALAVVPGYSSALDGLARVEAAHGSLANAIALQRRAAAAVPLPHLVAQLGDLLAAAGRKREAREQFALVAAIDRLQTANGVDADLETALYRADRGIDLAATLELARRARARRPSIHGDDTLAWALARNGLCAEARAWSRRSLRLGTRNASFFFHRGMIERCLGRAADAGRWFRLALDTNPHFSIRWRPTARRYAQ